MFCVCRKRCVFWFAFLKTDTNGPFSVLSTEMGDEYELRVFCVRYWAAMTCFMGRFKCSQLGCDSNMKRSPHPTRWWNKNQVSACVWQDKNFSCHLNMPFYWTLFGDKTGAQIWDTHARADRGFAIGYPLLHESTKCAEDSVLQNVKLKQDRGHNLWDFQEASVGFFP
jgi:hypothetical protein